VRKTQKTMPLGFAIRCDDFTVTFYETGAPKEYRSKLSILQNDKVMLTRDIIVNKPLRLGGINIFQSSYGEIPGEKHLPSDLSSKKIRLNIFNQHTGMTLTKELAMGGTVELPEGAGFFLIKEFKKSADFRGQDIGEAFLGMIMEKGKDPVEVLLPLRYPNFDKMRGGNFVFSLENIDDLLVSDNKDPVYFTGLQITRDPGMWVVYSGFILMLIGCWATFFMSHQQIFIEVTPTGKKCRVLLAGISNKNTIGMESRLKKLSEVLK
jgi:cytochrome c biogenesis protein